MIDPKVKETEELPDGLPGTTQLDENDGEDGDDSSNPSGPPPPPPGPKP